jgi:phage tail-like protein
MTPLAGFHFIVTFEMFPQYIPDVQFQSVSGLKSSIETEQVAEGGQNRFKHVLPMRSKYENLVLKRGLTTQPSGITLWCNQAIEEFIFSPVNLVVTLLNESHLPVKSWFVAHAIPVGFEISEFNAEENKMVIQTLTLSYNYFKEIPLPTFLYPKNG